MTQRLSRRETLAGFGAYASDTGRDTFNDTDGIFDDRLLLDLSERDDGYLGLISFDVEPA
jgi:hypothetical protein